MPLTLIETAIAGNAVRMRLADHAEPTQANEWIEFRVIPAEYQIGSQKLSEHSDRMPFAATRLAALLRVQSVIAPEIARLKGIVGTLA
jgi:hypothetical protein